MATRIHGRYVNARVEPLGDTHNIDYERAMSTETCARITMNAITKRKRQVLTSTRGRIGQWI